MLCIEEKSHEKMRWKRLAAFALAVMLLRERYLPQRRYRRTHRRYPYTPTRSSGEKQESP